MKDPEPARLGVHIAFSRSHIQVGQDSTRQGEHSKNMGMDAQFARVQLVARCLLPGCRRAGPVAAGQFTEGELRLPYTVLGSKLRCPCGSRQVSVKARRYKFDAEPPSFFQRWYA